MKLSGKSVVWAVFVLVCAVTPAIVSAQIQLNDGNAALLPTVTLRPAETVRLPGIVNPETGDEFSVDCNSPVEWDADGNLIVFTSAQYPTRSQGRDLFSLEYASRPVTILHREGVDGGKWLEATYRDQDGTIYGWYHNEPPGLCADEHLTAPRIGAMVSRDNGLTWEDLGIILEAPADSLNCDTQNFYFAGGNGDFTVILDRDNQYFYFHYDSYRPQVELQGICMARMRFEDRADPIGKVWKWRNGDWNEPGLGGDVTPIIPVAGDWHSSEVDAMWGPAVHFNTHLDQYVMLLNRAVDTQWTQEGVYISYNRNLHDPLGWSAPQRLPLDPQQQAYPEVIGTAPGETDKRAGRVARLFLLGQSSFEIVFDLPRETLSAPSPFRDPLDHGPNPPARP
ncbi:MAG: hypothetical protein ACREEM_14850 [Blastocatellia bacterium]